MTEMSGTLYTPTPGACRDYCECGIDGNGEELGSMDTSIVELVLEGDTINALSKRVP